MSTTELTKEQFTKALQRNSISQATWATLKNSVYPGAANESILMCIEYCTARGLDPLKKPCHIVPMSVKDAKTNKYGWRDVILPGIYEYRTTAQRTGEYLGRSQPTFAKDIEHNLVGVKFMAPEYCDITVKRLHTASGHVAELTERVYFIEVVQTKKEDKGGGANARWTKAPRQMLAKCAEAAALRAAFPDELGGSFTMEETLVADDAIEGEFEAAAKPEVEVPVEEKKPAKKASKKTAAKPKKAAVLIGDNEVNALDSMSKDLKVSLNVIYTLFKIDKLADLPLSCYAKAEQALKDHAK